MITRKRPVVSRKARISFALLSIKRALIVQRELLKGLLNMTDPPNGPEIKEAWDAIDLAAQKLQRACRRRGL